jgi:hypothetical protein
LHDLGVPSPEAGKVAQLCRLHLNLLDNCAALLEVLGGLANHLLLPVEMLRSAAVEVKAQQDEIRPLYELATRKPPALDPLKLIAAAKHAGEAARPDGTCNELWQQGRPLAA